MQPELNFKVGIWSKIFRNDQQFSGYKIFGPSGSRSKVEAKFPQKYLIEVDNQKKIQCKYKNISLSLRAEALYVVSKTIELPRDGLR